MIYEKLFQAALKASNEQDLPDTLFASIRFICEGKNSDPELIRELIDHLENYEPFGDVGCGNLFSSTRDVEQCVAKLFKVG
ncbi:MAG: GSU3529 family protein [Deferribacterales bacterium]